MMPQLWNTLEVNHMQWLKALLKRLALPPNDYYTTDGGRLAPYPEMTDEDLFDFERDMKVPNPTWATFEDFAKDQLKLGLRSGFVRGEQKQADDPLELLASKTVARNLAGHALPERTPVQSVPFQPNQSGGLNLNQLVSGAHVIVCTASQLQVLVRDALEKGYMRDGNPVAMVEDFIRRESLMTPTSRVAALLRHPDIAFDGKVRYGHRMTLSIEGIFQPGNFTVFGTSLTIEEAGYAPDQKR